MAMIDRALPTVPNDLCGYSDAFAPLVESDKPIIDKIKPTIGIYE